MDNLNHKRHSLAHLLGAAVKELYGNDANLAIGPATDVGFYYDVQFPTGTKIGEDDLKKIEEKMLEIFPTWERFEKEEVSKETAQTSFSTGSGANPFKAELIEEITKKGEVITLYKSGKFTDLCRGGHVSNMKEIEEGSWKISHVAGAYWRGDEKKEMLTRIYGLAFETKKDLDDYLLQIEEALKRDHKKLGRELNLFMFHETSPGMPYWLPKGLVVYNELVNYWRVEHTKLNYQEISSPLINKAELWKTSGHWNHYKDDMFIADMGDNEVYGIKPMNCPNAMVVFKSMQVSYRDLPLRLSDTDRLHRYERSGVLNGLLRVRSFQQDDSHNFISEEMVGSEYEHIFELCKKFYGIFGLEYSFRLGTRPEKFLGEKETWDKAEVKLKEILDNSGKTYSVAEGDGAFYGPKVDILMKDSLGREWQMGTIQLDFQLPQRFKLGYTDKDGLKKTPVVVHRVIYGSLERFLGILIEHTAGAFPLWLSPIQVRVLPIGENHLEYAKQIFEKLKEESIRVELDQSNESLGKKIRNAKTEKINYMLVIGDKEVEANKVTLESRDNGNLGQISADELVLQLKEEIKNRK